MKQLNLFKNVKITIPRISNFRNDGKHTLLTQLVSTSTAIILFSLFVCGTVTFLITKDKVTQDFKSSTIQILNQNKNYIELLNSNIENLSMQVLSDKKFADFFEDVTDFAHYSNKKAISDTIHDLVFSSNPEVVKGIVVLNEKEQDLSASSDGVYISDETVNKLKLEPWYVQAIKLNGKSFWTAPYVDMIASTKEPIISHVRVLKNTASLNNFALLKIDIHPEILQSTLRNAKIGKNGYIFIVNNEGFIISHKDPQLMGQPLKDGYFPLIKNSKEGSFEFDDHGAKLYGVYTTSEVTGWKFIALVPKAELSSTATSIGIITLGIILVCVILSIFISFFTAKQISKPLEEMIEITKELSAGNFTIQSKSHKLYELNRLSKNFNNMIGTLKEMLTSTATMASDTDACAKQLLEISRGINEATIEISGAAQEIASGSTNQTETAITCVDISNSFNVEVTTVVEGLSSVNAATDNALSVIDHSELIIQDLSKTSEKNQLAMTQVEATILNLDGNTKNILTILSKINTITEQTNLLALNASIEAARAGEAGLGFSVVANEIRKLADQSQKASLEIKKIIDAVNGSIKSSLDISATAQLAFKEELIQVSNTTQSFTLIKNAIDNILSAMEVSMSSIKQIDSGKDILNQYINKIATISEQNTASTEEVTASIQHQSSANNDMHSLALDLNEKASLLKEIISRFNV